MSDFFRKAQFPLLMACAAFPLAAAATVMMGPAMLPCVWGLAGLHLLLALLCLALPRRIRLAVGAAGCAAMIGLGAALLPLRDGLHVMLLPVGYAALLAASLPIASWPREREPSAGWQISGLVIHLAVQVLSRLNVWWVVNRAELLRLLPVLGAAFVVYLALMMLSMTRVNLRQAAMGRQRVPARVRRWNMLLAIGLLALALGLAAIPGIAQGIRTLLRWIAAAVMAVVASLISLVPELPGASHAPSAYEALPYAPVAPEQSADPSLLTTVLIRIFAVIVVLALILLALAVIRFLYRRLKRLIRYLRDRLSILAASEDYVDEITDTRDDAEERALLSPLSRLRRGLLPGSDRRLPPRERIRRRYQRLQWRHPEWQASRTARENLSGGAADLYERARYSGHEVSEEDAGAFERAVRKH